MCRLLSISLQPGYHIYICVRGKTGFVDKRFIQEQELLEDSYRLAVQIYQSGYRPDFIVGVWRTGLSDEEIVRNKPWITPILDELRAI